MEADGLLRLMVEKGASDLHLTVQSPPVLPIDGVLVAQEDVPALVPSDIESVLERISTREQRLAFGRELELDFAYSVPGVARFRVNVLRQRSSLSLAFRLIPFSPPVIDELGLPQVCKELIRRPRGLILVTGAAGSGKSTTLAAMIEHLNETEKRNVITIEDPIEYLFRNKQCIIRQRGLGDDTRSFSAASMHAMRHDPDVLVIGELRDLTTVSTAIMAAETGHLVLGTLHTADTPQSIDRLVGIFPYGQQQQVKLQLSQVIEAILSQRLLPRVGGGQVAAFEIMIVNNVVRRQIREDRIYEILPNMEMSVKEGMLTMDQSLADLVRKGVVTEEDALAKSTNRIKLQHYLQYRQQASTLENIADVEPVR
jgi:twitching motility protein PilT